MANPNIVNVTSIYGRTNVANVIDSTTTFLENGAASGEVYKINSLIISNVDGSNNAIISVDLYRSSIPTYIVKTITIPADSSFTAVDKNMSIYLEEGDAIRLLGSANDHLQAICSYEVIS